VVSRAIFHLSELRLDRGLFTLVFAHLTEDGIFLESLQAIAVSAYVLCRAAAARLEGANLDVFPEGEVSVGMRPRAVDGHGLPLRRRRGVVGTARPLAVLHLDGVKRWGCNGSCLEAHQRRQQRPLCWRWTMSV
jgi:hypothetical protein